MLAVAVIAVPVAIGLLSAPAPVSGEVVTTFTDPEILESSGLVVTDELAVTVNDSGDEPRIFTVSLDTGETVGVTRWDGAARDVEALAPVAPSSGPAEVWVGDIGDNFRARSSITVTKVPFGPGDQRVPGETFELSYPDGARDAEALLSGADGRLFVVSKDVLGGTVYAAPPRLRADGVNELQPVAEAPGLVTDGAFFPDGRHAILRNYGKAHLFRVTADGGRWREVGSFALPAQQQGEGIAVDPSGRVLLSSEGADSKLLSVALPAELARAVGEQRGGESAEGTAEGSGEEPSATDTPPAGSTEVAPTRDPWPWLLIGLVGLLIVVVLIRSLRPR